MATTLLPCLFHFRLQLLQPLIHITDIKRIHADILTAADGILIFGFPLFSFIVLHGINGEKSLRIDTVFGNKCRHTVIKILLILLSRFDLHHDQAHTFDRYQIKRIAQGGVILIPQQLKAEKSQFMTAFETNRLLFRGGYDIMQKIGNGRMRRGCMRRYDVVLRNLVSDSLTNAAVYADEGDISDQIILNVSVGNLECISESEQYFAAYQNLRDKLLEIGFGLQCNGSRINAVQSAMLAYAPQVYLVEMGKQALMRDLVNLWDYCEISDFPTTAQQNAYFQKWVLSLQ